MKFILSLRKDIVKWLIFLLDEGHTVIVGDEVEHVCCTLGKYTGDRLARLYPENHQKYYLDIINNSLVRSIQS